MVEESDYFPVAARGYTPDYPLPMRASNVTKVADWVETVVLITAQNVLHQSFPGLSHWRWSGDEDTGRGTERQLIRETIWRNHKCSSTPEGYVTNMHNLSVFIQPPWVLSPKDFEVFTSRRKVRRLQGANAICCSYSYASFPVCPNKTFEGCPSRVSGCGVR
jgi:hypothetical protein